MSCHPMPAHRPPRTPSMMWWGAWSASAFATATDQLPPSGQRPFDRRERKGAIRRWPDRPPDDLPSGVDRHVLGSDVLPLLVGQAYLRPEPYVVHGQRHRFAAGHGIGIAFPGGLIDSGADENTFAVGTEVFAAHAQAHPDIVLQADLRAHAAGRQWLGGAADNRIRIADAARRVGLDGIGGIVGNGKGRGCEARQNREGEYSHDAIPPNRHERFMPISDLLHTTHVCP